MDDRILRALAPVRNDPARSAVLLDLDGTMAPIIPDPQAVAIHPAIRGVLPQLRERYGLVAVVSGRQLGALRTIVGMEGIAYAGNHGLEIVAACGDAVPVPGVDLAPLAELATRWPPDRLTGHGVWLENKLQTLTFHYRGADDPAAASNFLRDNVAPDGRAAGLRVEQGRMSLEVHPAGTASKGTATAALLGLMPELEHVVSIGDDRTDTTVWQYLHGQRAAGRLLDAIAIGVLSAETPQVVHDVADYLVAGIEGTAAVLTHLVGTSGP